jgi:hypothetical protein
VSDRFELGRIRQAGLSPFDIKVLSTFMETGGEFPFYVDRLKPETRDVQLAGMNSLIGRDIMEVDTSRSNGHRWMLRLTDNGRALCAAFAPTVNSYKLRFYKNNDGSAHTIDLADLPLLTPVVSLEAVMLRHPQVILGGGSAISANELAALWRKHAHLAGLRDLPALHVDPDSIQRQTPRVIQGAVAVCEHLDTVRSKR